MTFILLASGWRVGFAAPAFLLVSAALAQAPTQQPDMQKMRQPTPSSIQQEDQQTNADKNRSEIDRKVREMDRRLSRTLRSVCIGC